MPYRLKKDGVLVQQDLGSFTLGNGRVITRKTTVTGYAGQVFDALPENIVKRIEAGEVDHQWETLPDPEGEAKAGDAPAPPDQNLYDPTAHKIDDVLVYLATVSDEEIARVKDVESKNKKRTGVAAFEKQAEQGGAGDGASGPTGATETPGATGAADGPTGASGATGVTAGASGATGATGS